MRRNRYNIQRTTWVCPHCGFVHDAADIALMPRSCTASMRRGVHLYAWQANSQPNRIYRTRILIGLQPKFRDFTIVAGFNRLCVRACLFLEYFQTLQQFIPTLPDLGVRIDFSTVKLTAYMSL